VALSALWTDGGDFATFYATGRAWIAGADVYASGQLPNLNPPIATLLFAPFAWLPLHGALVPWLILNLLGLLVSLRILGRELAIAPSLRGLVLIGLSLPALQLVHSGNLGWLLMVPATLAWRSARRDQWTQAGAWLGLVLMLKPMFLGFLIYVAWRRQWRALLACGAVGLGSLVLGAAIVGVDAYASWFRVVGTVNTANLSNASLLGLVGLWGLPRPWYGLAGAVVVGLTGWRLAQGPRSVDREWTIVWLASILISPIGWVYYLWFAAGPLLATFHGQSSRRLTIAIGLLSVGALPLLALSRVLPGPMGALFAPVAGVATLLLWWVSLDGGCRLLNRTPFEHPFKPQEVPV